MKTITLYEYDPQLRPGIIGADFEDGDPNHAYTLRFEIEELPLWMREWFQEENK